MAQSAFDFTLTSLTSSPLPLQAYAGRPMLIVNTASRCGFTPQYAGLQALWDEYRERELVVLGVPSNDFGRQEPGGREEIAGFCAVNYGVNFPMADKVPVRGREAHPLFRWLGEQGGLLSRPRWNFYKYLVGRDGQLLTWFGSTTPPGSVRLRAAVARALA
jgi:glutathione peroxidase